MDQIFERLEKLVKAWVSSGTSAAASSYGRAGTRQTYGDPDMDAAMAELDDFLDTSKTESEKREAEEGRAQAERERRAREEQNRRYRTSWGNGTSADATNAVIEDAYKYLGLKPYSPFAEVKAAYKKLLFKYHPDRNASTPDQLKKATETSTRINAAYQIIETYEESKKAR
ncbi:MAG TPA: J domain-containing protein [Rectinemataceae bacterium]|nr:J domain-containing protein [Rectinemataceae bacterium]